MTVHDDLPHPIPPTAYLRYKENYFFIIMSPQDGVFACLHFSNEPAFDRTKIYFDLWIKGERTTYHNLVPISPRFGQEPFVSDGVATMTVHESHKLFSIKMKSEDLDLDLKFEARLPTFDFHVCKYAAPELASFRDVATFGMNLPNEHINQSMLVSGDIRYGQQNIAVDGLGYRDHSWGFRADSATAWHTWSVINFPDRTFCVMNQRTQIRSGLEAREGCVVDAAGARAMRLVEIMPVDFSSGSVLPARVTYDITDALGERYSLEADVAGALARLGLVPEAASASQIPYTVTDNFCTIRDLTSGKEGIGLVELGFNREWKSPFS